MGREATCYCQWAGEAGECKVLLESSELIVRGPIRRRVLTASLTDVSAQGDRLHFRAGDDAVALTLGPALAQSWAKKIATPPPTLAAKLGITPATRLALIGEFATEELATAIAQSAATDKGSPSLILAMVKTIADLNHALDRYASWSSQPPMWIVYPKGPNKPIDETKIRDTLRRENFMDTKVASVSATLTALRFVKRG